nr:putative wax ester synthase/acyl-CoA:diacylglycerol acyltransferase [uncultured bacterium]
MSPAEALMWNVEKDPWLNPSGASLSIIDGPLDPEVLSQWLRAAVAALPRLRDRVEPGLARLRPPRWMPDPEFSFDYHVTHVNLPAPGTERELLDLVALLFQEPYDRTRPVWKIYAIGGLEGGRSALLMKMHHSIADGYGMARMQERFMVRDPDAAPPDYVDLDQIVAETCAAAAEEHAKSGPGVLDVVGAPAGLARRVAAEAALMMTDPTTLLDRGATARAFAQMAIKQLQSGRSDDDSVPSGSPLWTGRSRHRHLEILRFPLSEAKLAAKALGGSLNDVFMTALVEGAVSHHEQRDMPAHSFNTSFVISTRSDKSEGGNSFTPVRVQIPAEPMSPQQRFAAVQERIAAERSATVGGGLMGSMAWVVNLLPTSVTTRVARSQGARIDFATTNVRGSAKPLYIAGQPMTEIYAPGPVAGSAMIVAVISYLDTMCMMMTIDPAAIPDGPALRADVEQAFADLVTAAA